MVQNASGRVEDLEAVDAGQRGLVRRKSARLPDQRGELVGGTVEVPVQTAVQRELHPPVDEGAGGRQQHQHGGRESRHQSTAQGDPRDASAGTVHGRSTRYPTPRRVVIVCVPNGRSIVARRLAKWTSITLLRRSASPSQTSSRIM